MKQATLRGSLSREVLESIKRRVLMRKTLFVVAILALFVATAYAAIPDNVMIDKAKAKQPGVSFPHAKHVEVVKSCDTCHHTNKGVTAAKAAEVKACTSCHLNPKDAAVPNMAEMSMTKNPFHMECVKCHKADKKGPTVCKDCHKK